MLDLFVRDAVSGEKISAVEEIGSGQGWVAPLTQEDKEYFTYLRTVFKRYNIVPSKATWLEYDFVIRVAESEFYLQRMPDPHGESSGRNQWTGKCQRLRPLGTKMPPKRRKAALRGFQPVRIEDVL